jgi:hypothetical protein
VDTVVRFAVSLAPRDLTAAVSIATRHPIACCVEAPDAFVPKARYALGVLLAPLGYAPRWVSRDGLADGGIYYGQRPHGLSERVVAILLEPDTLAYFASGKPYDPADARWFDWDGDPWAVVLPRAADGAPDLIASAFFWLSGWQEVTTRERDEHGRFPYRASLQAALGCVEQPLVDVYRERLAGMLAAAGLPVRRQQWHGREWALVMTHDVDLLRKRRLGTVARAFLRRDRQGEAAFRQAVFARDPRRLSLDRMATAERVRGASATYFFKTAARGVWDVPYAHDSPYLRALVADLETTFEIGLHPSYFGHDHPTHLHEERDRLQTLTRVPPTTVRQHFLRFDDITPRLQEAAGFRLDSTLGFARREGFRRGTGVPFPLFDVGRNRPLDLWELPLVGMDTTLFTHRGFDAEAAKGVVDGLLDACRRVGGCCTLLWHNTAYDEVDFPGQAAVFEHALDRALAGGAALLSAHDAATAMR